MISTASIRAVARVLAVEEDVAEEILREDQDRNSPPEPTKLASIKDVAELIGRTKGTILSWVKRGQHDCPTALGTCSAGIIWDLADWKQWGYTHQGLLGRDASLDAADQVLGRTDLV